MTSEAKEGNGPPTPEPSRAPGLRPTIAGEPRAIRADATILENRDEGAGNRRLRLELPDWPESLPGQFAMLSAGARTEIERTDPLLPRPMAIFRTHRSDRARASGAGGSSAEVEVLYKCVGRGTRLLAEALPGQRIRVVGPLGQPFPPADPGTRPILVGGGTGIASLFELAARESMASEVEVQVLLGARSAPDFMAREDFEKLGVGLTFSTEDGSLGQHGLVTKPLEAALGAGGLPAVVYACGPTPMMRACAEVAVRHGARCLVSLENHMACGFGVCLGCAAPLAAGAYALVCRAGPVFDASEIDWETLP